MKKHLLLLLAFSVLCSCNENTFNNNNPYLPNYTFSIDINTNLPSFSNLKFASNAVFTPEVGVRGIIIFNTGSGYTAFDAACPNQALSSCSTMTIKGINALCSCDDSEYSLFTGQCIGTKCTGKQYAMKQYRVEVKGNVISVYN
jgi:nitrite reductase/ring-hydroxylating ferredoxin subunit